MEWISIYERIRSNLTWSHLDTPKYQKPQMAYRNVNGQPVHLSANYNFL